MEQEQKELLLRDLCARLPYDVYARRYVYTTPTDAIESVELFDLVWLKELYAEEAEFKPYLFPLSSMTEEQYKEWCDLEANPLDDILTRNANGEKMSKLEHHLLIAKSLTNSVNYCYKNHFDIYGLIPMGLAIDATGLNIY